MMYYRISKNEKNLFFGKKIAQMWAVTLSTFFVTVDNIKSYLNANQNFFHFVNGLEQIMPSYILKRSFCQNGVFNFFLCNWPFLPK